MPGPGCRTAEACTWLAGCRVRQQPVQTARAGHHHVPVNVLLPMRRLLKIHQVRSGGCGHAADRVAGLRQPEQVQLPIRSQPRHGDSAGRSRLGLLQLGGIAVRRPQPMWTHPVARSLGHRTPLHPPGSPCDPRPPSRLRPATPQPAPRPAPRPRATNHRQHRWPSDSPTRPTPHCASAIARRDSTASSNQARASSAQIGPCGSSGAGVLGRRGGQFGSRPQAGGRSWPSPASSGRDLVSYHHLRHDSRFHITG
jgi:hypothetical protein